MCVRWIIPVLCLAASLWAQDLTVEQRLAAMELREKQLISKVDDLAATLTKVRTDAAKRVEALEAQLVISKGIDAARVEALEARVSGRDTALEDAIGRLTAVERLPSSASRIRVGGYFDIELRSDEATDRVTFDQHRFVLKFDAEIASDISFRSEIEWEGGGAGVGYLSNNYIAIEYAELHFHIEKAFSLKAGGLLVPFGRINEQHDSPQQDLTDRPLVATYVVPTTWTESGLGAYGNIDLGFTRSAYDVIVSNGLDQNFSATAGGGLRDMRSSYRTDNNNAKQVTGRLTLMPDVEFLDATVLGISGAHGTYSSNSRHAISMWGIDAFARKGPFEFVGEMAFAKLSRDAALVAAGAPGGTSGWYVEGRWHFFPSGWRGESQWNNAESTFTLVVREERVDTDDSSSAIDFGTRGAALRDDLRRTTIGINYRPVERSVIKLEYQFLREARGIDVDNDRIVLSFATSF